MCGVFVFASLALASPRVSAVGHEGRLSDDGIGWETQLVVTSWGLNEELRVELASPLPPDTQLMGADFGLVEPLVDDEGWTTALSLTELEARPGRLRIYSFQSNLDRGLEPPLVAGELQRVELDGAAFDPDPRLGIHRHLRFQAQQDLQASERRALDRKLDGRGRPGPGRHPIYLEGDARLSEGLAGELRPDGQRSLGLGLFVAAVFAGVVLMMLAAHRLLLKMEAREAG